MRRPLEVVNPIVITDAIEVVYKLEISWVRDESRGDESVDWV
jgi:hypothetical protein